MNITNKNIYKLNLKEKYDSNAVFLLEIIEKSGYEAYFVGGCVRDLLLNKKPSDWDITTSAMPDKIVEILHNFNVKTFDNAGMKYGTVSAIINEKIYEITTFRRDIYGQNSHLPDKVLFTENLKEDLSRRDFTINAMASDRNGNIYDYFGGQSDLQRKILKTVGDSEKSFCEDALRLFRACRFLGQLNFEPDNDLISAMPYAFYRVSGLSLERVKREINKLVLTDYASKGFDLMVRTKLNETRCSVKENGKSKEIDILPELSHLVDLPQMKEFHRFDAWKHSLVALDSSKPLLINRWAAFLHDIGKGMPGIRAVDGNKITDYNHDVKGSEMVEALFTRWKMADFSIKRISWLVRNHMKFHFFANNSNANRIRWVRRLAKSGQFENQKDLNEAFLQLLDVCKADIIGCGKDIKNTEGHLLFYNEIKNIIFKIPVSKKELKINKDIIKALEPFVGEGIKNLFERVQNGTLNNSNLALYKAALRYRRRQRNENT